MRSVALTLVLTSSTDALKLSQHRWQPHDVELSKLKESVTSSKAFKDKVAAQCLGAGNPADCDERVSDKLFCQLLERSKSALHPEAQLHCPEGTAANSPLGQAPVPAKEKEMAMLVLKSLWTPHDVELSKLKEAVQNSKSFMAKVADQCKGAGNSQDCSARVSDKLFCQLLQRSKSSEHPEAVLHCRAGTAENTPLGPAPIPEKDRQAVQQKATPVAEQPVSEPAAKAVVVSSAPVLVGRLAELKSEIEADPSFKQKTENLMNVLGCSEVKRVGNCDEYVQEAAFCLAFADKLEKVGTVEGAKEETEYCSHIDEKLPTLSLLSQPVH